MTDPTYPLPTPDAAGRSAALDALRGVAVLGILVMNITSFAMPLLAYDQPLPGEGAVDTAVFATTSVLARGKFMTLFAVLFGAGAWLIVSRRRSRGLPAAGVFYRRMAVLSGVGLMHGTLIWHGDILLYYAVCGAVLYPFLRCRTRTLAWTAAGVGVVALLLTFGLGVVIHRFDEGGAIFADEVARMRGGFADVALVRIVNWGVFLVVAPVVALPWIFALMLLGVVLLRTGWLTAERSPRAYRRLLAAGLTLGLPLAAWRTAVVVWPNGWPDAAAVWAWPANVLDALLIAGAWLAAVMLTVRAGVASAWVNRLAAVGRMALTNYLSQSVICTGLFYGYGLGWFGHLTRAELLGVVLAVWALQLCWSPWWLARHRQGPLEAAWRRATYGKARVAER